MDRGGNARAAARSDSVAAAVYGSIVATALLTAFREEHVSAIQSAVSLLSTMAVFWLAHAWSLITAERILDGSRFAGGLALEIARSEWPLVEAALVPTTVLLLGWVGLLSDSNAVTAALVVCVLQLSAWGFVVGRRAYRSWFSAALSGVANGLLGLTLVALEVIVLH